VFQYTVTTALAPGQSIWHTLGPSDAFAASALSITAIPDPSPTSSLAFVMTVDNVNVTADNFTNYFAGCNVINNGPTTITGYDILVGLIAPED
jgi:hypothetical protein